MSFGLILKQLRTKKELTQNELAKILDVSKSNISKYEAGSIEPNMNILVRISEYFKVSVDYLLGREDKSGHGLDKGDIERRGLDGPGITDILGYCEEEEKIVTFPNKLSYQIDCNSAKIADVANGIGVSEKVILKWLDGTDDSYTNYYEKLSEYFETGTRYWTSPGALSPTIEPNIEEYLLIMAYRNYKNSGMLNEQCYGPLEHYFPGIDIISNTTEKKFLSVIRQLNEDNADILLGKAKELLKEQRYESVAADSIPLKKTGTDTPK